MSLLLMLLFLSMQAEKPAPPQGMPSDPGVFLRQSDGQWLKLAQVPAAEMKTKGLGTYLETDGLSNLAVTIVYKGAKAPLQIASARPTLYVRGVGSAADAMIVKFSRQKESRTLQSSSSAGNVENRGGFNRKDIQMTSVLIYSDHSFSVTPQQDLKPGEYLFLFGFANSGFDFGVVPAKKTARFRTSAIPLSTTVTRTREAPGCAIG